MPATDPFVYPPAPTDFTPWDQEAQQKAEKSREEENKRMGPQGGMLPKGDGKSLRRQAEELLTGKRAWGPGWVDWDVGRIGRGQVGAQVGM